MTVMRGVASSLALAVIACATYSERTDAARDELQRGDPVGAVAQLNKFMKVRSSEQLPNKWKKDFELVVLERAMILQALGDYETSARDFEVADKQLELLDISRDGAGKLGKYIYSDSATKFKTSPIEKMSINAMNLCNYLVKGDLRGARIEAKRFTVMRNYMRDYDPEHEHNAFGSYVAGFVFEHLGEPDEALRYYDEALQEREFASLKAPIERLAVRGSYRGERIKDYLPSTPSAPAPKSEPPPVEAPPAETAPSDAPPVQRPSAPPPAAAELGTLPGPTQPWSLAAEDAKSGEILVIAKTGRVPYKVPKRIPIGLAIGLAGAFVTGDTTLLEYGMFKFVTYPELVPHDTVFDFAEASVDGHALDMELATDVTGEIVAEYEDMKPKIIGAALTRMIARAAAAEAGRAAGNQAEGAGGIIGFLAAAAIEGTMVALDKPDTRSWTTLPARIHVARAMVPAGTHSVTVTVRGPGGMETRRTRVKVAAGGFAVVDVTTLR
jgi:tetratricopeptide (TPR) repeat protein